MVSTCKLAMLSIPARKSDIKWIDRNQPPSLNHLVDELARVSPQKNKARAKITAAATVGVIVRLHKAIFGKPWDFVDFNWLKDVEQTIKFILNHNKWKTRNTRVSIIAGIAAMLRNIEDLELQDLYFKYSSVGNTATGLIDALKIKNIGNMTASQKENILHWDTVLAIGDSSAFANGGSAYHRAV